MKWLPNDIPTVINGALPTATLVALDLEYAEDSSEVVCVGMFDGTRYYFYSAVSEALLHYLRSTNWLVVDGIHAELPVLNKLYGGFSTKNILDDVKIMGYVFNSAAKDWSLKNMAKTYLAAEWPKYNELKKEYKFKNIAQLPLDVLQDYNGSDCFYTWKLWEYFRKNFNTQQWAFYNNIERPTNFLLYEMETKGIKIDEKEVRRIHKEKSTARRKAKKLLLESCGVLGLNPNSPKQVKQVLESLNITSKTTGEDDLKRYAKEPFVHSLLEYRGLQKITSTYTIPLYTNAIQAHDNRIHARFGQNTITGRLSSSDPINLQNQPKEVRSAFVAKEGHTFVDADWSNLELRLPAHFSGEPGFIEELSKTDGDLHRRTASLIYGADVESRSDYKEKRQIAKTCNFLLTNSGSAKRLATELGCSLVEANDIYNRFWRSYPVLAQWSKATKEEARRQKGVQTLYGRLVLLPKITAWCGRSNCPVFGSNGYWCKECFIREETEREAVSIRVQGTGADLVKLAMLRLRREYGLVPVLSVHDSVVYEVEDSKLEEVREKVKYVMENVASLRVPLIATMKAGKSWGEVKE